MRLLKFIIFGFYQQIPYIFLNWTVLVFSPLLLLKCNIENGA